MTWSRHFDKWIDLPDGRKLRTLKDAAEYILALPPNIQKEERWQHAAECLTNAAELEIAWMSFAQSAMMQALHGSADPLIGNPEGKKGERW